MGYILRVGVHIFLTWGILFLRKGDINGLTKGYSNLKKGKKVL